MAVMSATGLTVDVNELCRKFEALKKHERNRQDFLQTLIDQVKELNREREKHAKALRATEILATTYQDRFESAEKRNSDLQRAIDCDIFVLVLVDGDNTLFQDDYVRDGIQGGERAARELRQALFDCLKDKQYFKHDFKIVTKIFLNLAGLSKTYCDANIIPESRVFQQFIHGFNKTHVFSEIIDAGNGKEGADNKIKAEVGLFQRNLHCKQIVLASSGDNSYGGLLRQYAPSTGRSERITLIEALPFAQELRALTDSFETVRLKNVFRDTKIARQRFPFGDTGSRTRTPSSTSDRALESLATPSVIASSAFRTTAGNLVNNPDGFHTASLPERTTAPVDHLSHSILVNHLGHRVDEDLNVGKSLIQTVKKLKLCNKYYIGRNCNGGCGHSHELQLNPDQLKALRCVARLKSCQKGLQCQDHRCFDGHRCLAGVKCWAWVRGTCSFSGDMHQVDLSNLKTIRVYS